LDLRLPELRHPQRSIFSLDCDNNLNDPRKLAATLGTIIDRYMAEDFVALRDSTQTTNKSLIDLHIRPRWEHVRLGDVNALAVKQWLDKLPFGAAIKGAGPQHGAQTAGPP
jgi:hypothetical protein